MPNRLRQAPGADFIRMRRRINLRDILWYRTPQLVGGRVLDARPIFTRDNASNIETMAQKSFFSEWRAKARTGFHGQQESRPEQSSTSGFDPTTASREHLRGGLGSGPLVTTRNSSDGEILPRPQGLLPLHSTDGDDARSRAPEEEEHLGSRDHYAVALGSEPSGSGSGSGRVVTGAIRTHNEDSVKVTEYGSGAAETVPQPVTPLPAAYQRHSVLSTVSAGPGSPRSSTHQNNIADSNSPKEYEGKR